MIKEWTVKDSRELCNNRVFSLRKDRCISPETGIEHEFYVIKPPDWINVVAITRSGDMVLIKQYRHGIREVTIEIPGGMRDEGEKPLDTAKRELREETGYVSDNWKMIGEVAPNPAIQSNRCFTYLAKDADKSGHPEFDSTEYIETFTEPLPDVKKLVAENKITHSLVVAALYWYFLGADY